MTEPDPLLTRLGDLPVPALDPALSARILGLAEPRLVPRPLAPFWTVAVSLSVVGYLAWALVFTTSLMAAR